MVNTANFLFGQDNSLLASEVDNMIDLVKNI